VFVLGAPDCPEGWDDIADWLGEPVVGGFMLDVDGAGWVFEHDADEDLKLVGRRP
jgi:hypothetical protein